MFTARLTDMNVSLTTAVHTAQPGWRRVIAQAVLWGIPTPAFSTALAFFDGYRSEIVPANLLQAQVRLFPWYYNTVAHLSRYSHSAHHFF